MNRITAFFGSPRTGGYTAQLVHAALSGVRGRRAQKPYAMT
jgi:multimeric flavodoxin WrbA